MRRSTIITTAASQRRGERQFAQHRFLEGVDGIVVDVSGNIWSSVNERNALIHTYAHNGRSVEVFRNPPNAARVRNEGPLESPSSVGTHVVRRRWLTATVSRMNGVRPGTISS